MKEEPKTRNRGRPRTRFQPDVRLTVRFCPGRDDDLLAWLEELPDRQRAGIIRQTVRLGLNGDPAALETQEPQ
ncbi:MAG: hypothetical protein JXM73_00195 [Anaerolineae bacterium]|nr:hypothetical protein [Anaerolineae bacterium]